MKPDVPELPVYRERRILALFKERLVLQSVDLVFWLIKFALVSFVLFRFGGMLVNTVFEMIVSLRSVKPQPR